MRPTAALIVSSLAWTACSLAGPAQPQALELDKDFSLKPGEWMQSADASVKLGFEAVTADSRCPKNAQCMVAGEAIVKVWMQQGSAPRQTRELRSAAGDPQRTRVGDMEVRLLQVDPYPISGRTTPPQAYIATLTLRRLSPSSTER
jgi:hypothetical protein